MRQCLIECDAFAVAPTQRRLNVSSELIERQSQQEAGLSSSRVSS